MDRHHISDRTAQEQRLQRVVQHWRSLAAEDRDIILLGDANLCAMRWNDPDYADKQLADIIQDFNMEENFTQLVSSYTRSNLRRDIVEQSCIDHISTNVPAKCANISIVENELGSSDHAAISVLKYSREIIMKPATIKKRSYKRFNEENFVMEIRNTDFSEVLETEDITVAAEKFSNIFKNVLDNHAPIKIFQSRKHYAPWLTDETKEMIKKRNELKTCSMLD